MLTACGIETCQYQGIPSGLDLRLQQCLPLAVLKLNILSGILPDLKVATVLTACGIETTDISFSLYIVIDVATVLTACGIETVLLVAMKKALKVATVLTACGIETTFKPVLAESIIIVATALTACGIETLLPS